MTFDVSRSGYRHHFSDKKLRSEVQERTLVAEIKSIRRDPKLRSYGSPRMRVELCSRGHRISENTVAKLMRKNGIKARKTKAYRPRTTTSDPHAKYSPNLCLGTRGQSTLERPS